MQTILDGVLFVYALTNTNIAKIIFLKDHYFFFLEIMAILSAKSDVNGLMDKVWFLRFDLKSDINTNLFLFKNV